jgi:PAS domain S-box-containing protein
MKDDVTHILLIDDDEDDYILTRDLLKEIPTRLFDIQWTPSYDEGLKEILKDNHHLYLIDYRLGKRTGIDILKTAIKEGCRKPIIMLTGKGDQQIDMQAMRSGAADYLVKGTIDSYTLEKSIRYALERSASMEALRRSEAKYRNIFEKSRDVIYITTREGEFLDVNESAYRLFGYTRNELLQMNAKQLYSNQADRKKFEKEIRLKGEISDHEVELKTKSGDKIYCLLSSSLQKKSNNTPDTYQGIIHDITKRKKAERQQVRTEKLMVTGRIARSIAHEVRNPLTNVNLAIEQLENEIQSEESTSNLYLDIIKRNSERINVLITELLNSSKPSQLIFAKYSINKLLNESLELAMDRIILKEIKVVKNYSPLVCELSVDCEKLKLAFLNIIINAVEVMDTDRGVLKLETELQDDKCIIKIVDNGPGISQEKINQLFEPFFTEKSNGMGLGLTTAQNIIFSHGGSIDVDSTPGKGTTFILSFDVN